MNSFKKYIPSKKTYFFCVLVGVIFLAYCTVAGILERKNVLSLEQSFSIHTPLSWALTHPWMTYRHNFSDAPYKFRNRRLVHETETRNTGVKVTTLSAVEYIRRQIGHRLVGTFVYLSEKPISISTFPVRLQWKKDKPIRVLINYDGGFDSRVINSKDPLRVKHRTEHEERHNQRITEIKKATQHISQVSDLKFEILDYPFFNGVNRIGLFSRADIVLQLNSRDVNIPIETILQFATTVDVKPAVAFSSVNGYLIFNDNNEIQNVNCSLNHHRTNDEFKAFITNCLKESTGYGGVVKQ